MEERESEINLRDYLVVFSRRKWIIVLSVVVVTLSSIIFTPKRPILYGASAVIKAEEPSIGSEPFRGLGIYVPTTVMGSQKRLIKSMELAQETVRVLKSKIIKLSKEKGGTAAWIESRGAAKEVQNSISLREVPDTNFLEIIVMADMPVKAMDIANTVAKLAVAQGQKALLEDVRKAYEFADEQAIIFKQKMIGSEEALVRHKKEMGFAVQSGGGSDRISNLQNQYIDVKVKREIAENSMRTVREELAKRHSDMVPSIVKTQTPLIQKLRQQLVDLEVQRSLLLREYTEKHPSVAELQIQIDETREVLKEEARKAMGEEGITRDPWDVYQREVNMILDLEVEIDSLKVREESFLKMLDEYSLNIREAVDKDAELFRLARDAANNKATYDTMANQRERLQLAMSILKANVEVVRWAEEPKFPIKQRAGNRIILSMFLGLVLGVTVAFIEEHMDTSLKSIDDVKRYLNQPVIGVIPMIMTKQEREKRYGGRKKRHRA